MMKDFGRSFVRGCHLGSRRWRALGVYRQLRDREVLQRLLYMYDRRRPYPHRWLLGMFGRFYGEPVYANSCMSNIFIIYFWDYVSSKFLQFV